MTKATQKQTQNNKPLPKKKVYIVPGEKPRWQQLHEAHAEKQKQLDQKRRERKDDEEAEDAQHSYKPRINSMQ